MKNPKKKLSNKRLGVSYPRQKPHTWHTEVHFPVAAVVIGFWALLGIFTGVFVYLYAGHGATQPYSVSVNGKDGFVTAEVQKVSFDTKGSEPFYVPAGQKFAILTIELENYTDTVFNLAPVVQTAVIDETGKRYGMSPAVLSDPIVAGPLKPNATVEGQVSYLVPANAKHLTFAFDAESPQSVHMTYRLK